MAEVVVEPEVPEVPEVEIGPLVATVVEPGVVTEIEAAPPAIAADGVALESDERMSERSRHSDNKPEP